MTDTTTLDQTSVGKFLLDLHEASRPASAVVVYADLLRAHELPETLVEDMSLVKAGLIVWREAQGFVVTDRGWVLCKDLGLIPF